MPVTLALAGDTMLGRLVAPRLVDAPFDRVFAPEIREIVRSADICVLNLECCVSDRGARWQAPGKPFFFRAPPRAAEALAWLGVDCVTLANNHALDYGYTALADTIDHLNGAGVAAVGAGATVEEARRWRTVAARGLRLGVLGVTDHPPAYAAGPASPGVAYADLWARVPDWLPEQVGKMAGQVDVALVTPHWGPNMTSQPVRHVRAAARALLDAGAGLVAGHSAHVFHGMRGPVLYDLGDFVDDYAVDPDLRNDLGLLFLVVVDDRGASEVTAVPIAIDDYRTRLADPAEADWIGRRFIAACARLGTHAEVAADRRLVVWLR